MLVLESLSQPKMDQVLICVNTHPPRQKKVDQVLFFDPLILVQLETQARGLFGCKMVVFLTSRKFRAAKGG